MATITAVRPSFGRFDDCKRIDIFGLNLRAGVCIDGDLETLFYTTNNLKPSIPISRNNMAHPKKSQRRKVKVGPSLAPRKVTPQDTESRSTSLALTKPSSVHSSQQRTRAMLRHKGSATTTSVEGAIAVSVLSRDDLDSITSNLPFLALSRVLEAEKLSHYGVAVHAHTLTHDVPTTVPAASSGSPATTLVRRSPSVVHQRDRVASLFRSLMKSKLEASLPRSAFPASLHPNATEPLDGRSYSELHLRYSVYLASNNFPGFDNCCPRRTMFEYVRDPLLRLIDSTFKSMSLPDLLTVAPSARPLAKFFFSCAIEAGDSRVVKGLLCWKDAGIDVNHHACSADELWSYHRAESSGASSIKLHPIACNAIYTPIERASMLNDFKLVKLLLQSGADAILSHPRDHLHKGKTPNGALQLALCAASLQTPVDLIDALWKAEAHSASLRSRFRAVLDIFSLRLEHDCPSEIAKLIILNAMRFDFDVVAGSGLLHQIVQYMDSHSAISVLGEMQAHSPDKFNEIVNKMHSDNSWTVMDTAVRKGDLELVTFLKNFNAAFSRNTLVEALRSRNQALISFLLEHDAPKSSAKLFGEAIRTKDDKLIAIFKADFVSNPKVSKYELAFDAAFETWDWSTIKFLHEFRPPSLRWSHAKNLGRALRRAAWEGTEETALAILEAGALIKGSDWKCTSTPQITMNDCPLLIALMRGFDTLALMIVHAGANHTPICVSTALKLAVQAGSNTFIDVFIRAGAHLEHALVAAISRHDIDLVRFLLSEGADPSVPSDVEVSPLTAAIQANDLAILQLLLDSGADPADERALLQAVSTNLLQSASGCANIKCLLNTFSQRYRWGKGSFGVQSLQKAIELDRADVVQMLLNSNIKPERTPNPLRNPGQDVVESPMAEAIRSGPEMTQILLKAGIDPNCLVQWGSETAKSALLLAIQSANLSTVRLLLAAGANVNAEATGRVRATPLQMATKCGSMEMVRFLLERGADVNGAPAREYGATALQLAASGGFLGIAELLLENGADPTAAAALCLGATALEGAASMGRFDMLKLLLDIAQYEDTDYQNAIDQARRCGESAMVDMIEDARARTATAKQPPLSCAKCGTLFSNRFTLKRHQDTVHGADAAAGAFACDECSEQFSRKDNLERHKKSHSKDGYVPCPHCQAPFRKDYLKSHLEKCQARQQA